MTDASEAYGELREDLHFTGYAFERGCHRLRKLLSNDGWKQCGGGFTNVDDFLASLQLDQFAKLTEERREIKKLIRELRPEVSTRAIERAFKVGEGTLRKNSAANTEKTKQTNDDVRGNSALSGAEAAKAVERRAAGIARRQELEMEQRERRATALDLALVAERFEIIHGDMREAAVAPETVDVVLTDPPYPEEFLSAFGWLADCAARWLKPGGSLVIMSGQTYLPAVFDQLRHPDLFYHWTLAYLTPGGQATQIFPRRVQTFWKPVLWFVKGEYDGPWIGDVARSNPNDNDKRFHNWGQSESGFADLMDRVSQPGQLILDPFCGGGTTGVVALKMGRRFIGIDAELAAVNETTARLHAIGEGAAA